MRLSRSLSGLSNPIPLYSISLSLCLTGQRERLWGGCLPMSRQVLNIWCVPSGIGSLLMAIFNIRPPRSKAWHSLWTYPINNVPPQTKINTHRNKLELKMEWQTRSLWLDIEGHIIASFFHLLLTFVKKSCSFWSLFYQLSILHVHPSIFFQTACPMYSHGMLKPKPTSVTYTCGQFSVSNCCISLDCRGNWSTRRNPDSNTGSYLSRDSNMPLKYSHCATQYLMSVYSFGKYLSNKQYN